MLNLAESVLQNSTGKKSDVVTHIQQPIYADDGAQSGYLSRLEVHNRAGVYVEFLYEPEAQFFKILQ